MTSHITSSERNKEKYKLNKYSLPGALKTQGENPFLDNLPQATLGSRVP